MADQLTTVSKARLQNRVGRLSDTDMQSVEQAIRVLYPDVTQVAAPTAATGRETLKSRNKR